MELKKGHNITKNLVNPMKLKTSKPPKLRLTK